MVDALALATAFAGALLFMDLGPKLDPGPSPECPNDMRLVTGRHHDEMQHLCIDPRKDTKDTHCFAYFAGLSAEEGAVTEIRTCMDQFEAPNQRGARPLVMRSYNMAKKWCGQRGKRVCTEQEWEHACEGPDHRPLAYGWKVERSLCNSDKGWRPFDAKKLAATGEESDREVERLWQGSPSGQYRTCVSAFGIHDLMGNVEEWTTSRKERRWPGTLRGGFWAKPWTGCRGANDAHEPTFTFYETGFRCCMDAKPPATSTNAVGR